MLVCVWVVFCVTFLLLQMLIFQFSFFAFVGFCPVLLSSCKQKMKLLELCLEPSFLFDSFIYLSLFAGSTWIISTPYFNITNNIQYLYATLLCGCVICLLYYCEYVCIYLHLYCGNRFSGFALLQHLNISLEWWLGRGWWTIAWFTGNITYICKCSFKILWKALSYKIKGIFHKSL